MTLIWFAIWLAANIIGGSEPLRFDPVNVWAGTLLLAVALDLGRQHATGLSAPAERDRRSGATPRPEAGA